MKIIFSCVSCFKEFYSELDCQFSWWYGSHNSYTLTLLNVFSWFCFHEYDMCLIVFECLMIMWLTCFSWNIFLFYSLLEGFRTSLQIFHITSSYSSYGRVFKRVILFSNLFLKIPTLPRAVGWATMPCMLIIENLFKTCAWNGW